MIRKTMLAAMLAAVLAGLLTADFSSAGSLWEKGNRRTRNLFADDTAREVGDLLTILINERSIIDNKTDRNAEKKTGRTAAMNGTLDLANLTGSSVGEHIFDFPRLNFASSSDSKFEGKNDLGSDRLVTDQITVTIVDVLPNGNLVFLGTRTRETLGDRQIIELSGIVRPTDVSFNNTVSSERVADFQFVYKTRGHESTYVNPGWLTRLGNWLNPF
jgi:flagellar L-ring protein precursor FlgH